MEMNNPLTIIGLVLTILGAIGLIVIMVVKAFMVGIPVGFIALFVVGLCILGLGMTLELP